MLQAILNFFDIVDLIILGVILICVGFSIYESRKGK